MNSDENGRRKFIRELKVEDFVIMAKQNKEYQHLISILKEKEKMNDAKHTEKDRYISRLQNQKEEYKIKCHELEIRMAQFQLIKNQLIEEYDELRSKIYELQQQKAKDVFKIQQISQNLQKQIQSNDLLSKQIEVKSRIADDYKENNLQLMNKLMKAKIDLFEETLENKKIKLKENKRGNK